MIWKFLAGLTPGDTWVATILLLGSGLLLLFSLYSISGYFRRRAVLLRRLSQGLADLRVENMDREHEDECLRKQQAVLREQLKALGDEMAKLRDRQNADSERKTAQRAAEIITTPVYDFEAARRQGRDMERKLLRAASRWGNACVADRLTLLRAARDPIPPGQLQWDEDELMDEPDLLHVVSDLDDESADRLLMLLSDTPPEGRGQVPYAPRTV